MGPSQCVSRRIAIYGTVRLSRTALHFVTVTPAKAT